MKTLLTLLLLAASAFGQTATISDTIRTPFGGTFSGTVTVSLNSPGLAQPLYSGSITLSGWTQAVTVTAGVFNLTLYTNDLITPGGTSYTATYAPTSGSGWKETWIVPAGATTIREIRSTTVPSPSVRFNPSQITQAGATLGQGLKWDGSKWAPADVVANPMTATGDLITRSGGVPVRVGIGSTNQVLTVSGGMPVWASGITGNASTATALAANGTNCSAGSYPLGVDASGNAEGCTAAVTASTGLSDSAALVRNNQANTYTAGSKQTFASNATTAGAAFGGGITADPSSVTAGDFWYRADLGTFGFRNATAVDALVAGGRALTTPGSVPFVTSAGVLGQDATAFSYSAANDQLSVGAAGENAVIGRYGGSVAGLYLAVTPTANNYAIAAAAGNTQVNSVSTSATLTFSQGNTERARFAATTGNLLLGTTTDDGSNRLQVAGAADITGIISSGTVANGRIRLTTSGSVNTGFAEFLYPAGARLGYIGFGSVGGAALPVVIETAVNGLVVTQSSPSAVTVQAWQTSARLMDLSASGALTLFNQTPTTGSTSLVVRAGAGQGSNNLTTWQNSSGSTLTSINFAGRLETSAGVFFTNSFGGVLGPLPSNMGGGKGIAIGFNNEGDGAVFARQYLLQGATATTTDISLARFAAGRLELNSGTAIGTTPANARDIMLRRTFAAETTTDPSAADLTIAGSNTQDVAAIYVKNDKLVVAYNRSGTVNYLTIPLDGATTTFTQSTTAP